MRTTNEIRENGFVVARQYLADAGARDRPIGPVYQLHLDVLDLLAALAEKDETIRVLNIDLELKDRQAEIVLRDNQLYIEWADAEIERLRAEIDALDTYKEIAF